MAAVAGMLLSSPLTEAAIAPELARMSIVMVDDDPSSIQVVRHVLRDHTDFRFATSARDAMRVLERRRADLILVDAEMPGENGFELCCRLKADLAYRDVPIVFVTSHDDLAFETHALGAGAADFIAKPIAAHRLRLRVRLQLQLKHQLDTIRAQAMVDAGTGIANRRALDQTLASEWSRARRIGRPVGFLLIDVDHFKAYNDHHGHPAGDRCLRAVASLAAEQARRPNDLAARFGGEEFALVLPHTDLDGARQVGEAIRGAIASAQLPHGRSPVAPHVTVSIGIHAAVPGDETGETAGLVEAADRALYAAKRSGRDRVRAASDA